jgi:hypothetical protein
VDLRVFVVAYVFAGQKKRSFSCFRVFVVASELAGKRFRSACSAVSALIVVSCPDAVGDQPVALSRRSGTHG